MGQQVGDPDPWMYVNVILEDNELLIPLPEDATMDYTLETHNSYRGLRLSWPAFRMGYFWGGDGEVVLRVDVRELGVQARLDGQGSCQVFHVPI